MTAWASARRRLVGCWILLAAVVWNGLYDLRITLGVRDYLLRQALHAAGEGPAVAIDRAMQETVRDAVLVASLWAAILLAAGLWTIWYAGRAGHAPAPQPAGAPPA